MKNLRKYLFIFVCTGVCFSLHAMDVFEESQYPWHHAAPVALRSGSAVAPIDAARRHLGEIHSTVVGLLNKTEQPDCPFSEQQVRLLEDISRTHRALDMCLQVREGTRFPEYAETLAQAQNQWTLFDRLFSRTRSAADRLATCRASIRSLNGLFERLGTLIRMSRASASGDDDLAGMIYRRGDAAGSVAHDWSRGLFGQDCLCCLASSTVNAAGCAFSCYSCYGCAADLCANPSLLVSSGIGMGCSGCSHYYFLSNILHKIERLLAGRELQQHRRVSGNELQQLIQKIRNFLE